MFNFEFRMEQDKKFPPHTALIAFINPVRIKQETEYISQKNKIIFPEHIRTRIFNDEYKELKYYPADAKPELVIISKYNIDKKFSSDYFRNYLSGIAEYLYNESIENVYLSFPEYANLDKYFKSNDYLLQSCLEGLILGSYSFDMFISKKRDYKPLAIHLEGEKKELSAVIERTKIITKSIFYARDLANAPSASLTPEALAESIIKDMQPFKIKVDILDDEELQRAGMNGIYSVGKGSSNPPRFIIMHYKPQKSKTKICLIGKGVTFDSGGISIKPGAGMSEMKADMSGGAVVAAVIICAEQLKLPVEIFGLIPAVENMPSGNSFKPGDIIVTRSGKSVEVDNTDAEGRIILADALDYAKEQKPDLIIDLATLTGAAVVALGEYTAGLFSNNDQLAEALYNAGQITFERVWRMPIWEEYDNLIKSDVADVKNLGGKWGGAITAAKFLQKFIDENTPWAHLDIAGPAMPHDLSNYTKKWMTGFGVRLIVEYLESTVSISKSAVGGRH